jgi:PAS domain S-box-containing protein
VCSASTRAANRAGCGILGRMIHGSPRPTEPPEQAGAHVNGPVSADVGQLKLTQSTLHLLLESAPIAIVAVNEHGTIVFANARLYDLFGYEAGELLGAPLELLLPERFHSDHARHRGNYNSRPHSRPMGIGMELLARRKNGSEFPMEAGLSHIRVDGKMLTLSSIVDVSRRKQTEEALERRVEERTREIERRRRVADSLRDVLAILNSNRPLQEILDFISVQASVLLGAEASAIYRLADDEAPLTILASFGLPQEMLAREGEGHEVASPYRAQLAVPMAVQDEIVGGLMLYYTAPRRFSSEEIELALTFGDQAKLAIENARLRAQSEQTAVAAERNRIARDLHDSVTQTLFSASLIAEVLPRLWERDLEESRRRLDELRSLTRGALAEMRTLLLELRPSTLIEVDINELLRQLTEAAIGRARIPIALNIEGNAPVPPDVKIAFYHVAQEALNNVTKHARAVSASIEIVREPNRTALRISDNGRGFVVGAVTPEHLGLTIMHERAADIGADLRVSSTPGEGTEIAITWAPPAREAPGPR